LPAGLSAIPPISPAGFWPKELLFAGGRANKQRNFSTTDVLKAYPPMQSHFKSNNVDFIKET
jgi:hypothetical protein